MSRCIAIGGRGWMRSRRETVVGCSNISKPTFIEASIPRPWRRRLRSSSAVRGACVGRQTRLAFANGRRQLVRGDIVIKVYDNAFSPFARKVRMVLEFKGLDFDAVDGLLETDHEALKRRERAHQDASSDRR